MANPDDESGQDSDCGEEVGGGVSLLGHEDMMDLSEGPGSLSVFEEMLHPHRSTTDIQPADNTSLSKLVDNCMDDTLDSNTASASVEHTSADSPDFTNQGHNHNMPATNRQLPLVPGMTDSVPEILFELPPPPSPDDGIGLNSDSDAPLFSPGNDLSNPFDQDLNLPPLLPESLVDQNVQLPSLVHEALAVGLDSFQDDHVEETNSIEGSLQHPIFSTDLPMHTLGGFDPHEEHKNMSFVECLSFCRTGHMIWLTKSSTPDDFFPTLTGFDIAEGMKSIRRGTVTASDVEQERCDIQGIDWRSFNVARNEIRRIRNTTYFNHVNVLNPNYNEQVANHWPMYNAAPYINRAGRSKAATIPRSTEYFRFARMSRQYNIRIPHFQLRHTVTASSKNAIFFPTVSHNENSDYPDETGSQITCLNPSVEGGDNSYTLDAAHTTADPDVPKMQKIFTLSATHGILAAGGFGGEYAFKPLSSSPTDPFTAGIITISPNSSTNHVHTYLDRRSGLPRAVFSSNDYNVHTLDCETNTFLSRHDHAAAVNCSATSPDTRLRVMVRDAVHPLLVESDTGKRIGKLSGHCDYGFACDWDHDGRYFATGAQDGVVQIFDARAWRKPVQTFATELGGVRVLKFSPGTSGGERVLAMAESADFVHLIRGPGMVSSDESKETQALGGEAEQEMPFGSKQTFDFFGEIAGIT
ncbi:MAG: hypothetical protein Q9222_006206, partial [Ikaeria aurantiellina]